MLYTFEVYTCWFDGCIYYNMTTAVVLANTFIRSHINLNLNLNKPKRETAREIKQWLVFAENNWAKLMIKSKKLFTRPSGPLSCDVTLFHGRD